MSRDKYVSREGLKQWLEELIKSPWAESTETRLALELVRDAAAMKVPASLQIQCADVEPVVRCQECKYSQPWYADKSRCFLWHESGIDVFNDGYCSYGKKEDVHNDTDTET